MKKIIAAFLVFAMLVCMVPAFSLAAPADDSEPEYGLMADFYQLIGVSDVSEVYRDIVGSDSGDDHRDSFDDTQRYDRSIEQLRKVSAETGSAENLTGFTPYDAGASGNGYMIRWTGTITAKTSGTYYFVGHKIDNGFVAFVKQNGEMKKVYEYWASHHWFNRDGISLYSNLGGFTLEADTPVDVEIWYLETNGGEALDMAISQSPDSGAMSFEEAGISFSLSATRYNTNLSVTHEKVYEVLPDGTPARDDSGNGSSAQEAGNHLYSSTIDALKERMLHIGSVLVPNYETESFDYGIPFGRRIDDYLIEYNGYVTPTYGGTYEFGTTMVDNCLFVEITDPDTEETTTVFEFWASRIWNDESATYSGTEVELEAGKSYKLHAVFLEIDGGAGVESSFKINGEVNTLMQSGLKFTTAPMENAPEITTEYYFKRGAEWYYMTSGENNDQTAPENWATDPAVYKAWETANADLGEKGSNVWDTDDAASRNQSLWAVKEFTVEDIDAIAGWAVMTEMFFDDNIHIYINGVPVFIHPTWNESYTTYKLAEDASSLLKTGTNTIAASLVQGHGGYAFDLDLYVTKEDTSSIRPTVVNIATADQLLAYVASVNTDPEAGKGQVVSINADIDMSGKAWTPINRFIGTIEGNGHTIKNLSYTAPVDSSSGNQYVGMFVTDLANNNANGRIRNLTFEDCSFTVKASGENRVYAGMVAGAVDRANLTNVVVKNGKLESDGYAAAGLAARACWGISDGHILNCRVENSSIQAVNLAAGLVAFTEGIDEVLIQDNTLAYTALSANKTMPGVGEASDNTRVEGLTVLSRLALEDGNDYQFYYQTRVNGDDPSLTDYRILCVADLDWLEAADKADVKISFTNGSDTKSTTMATRTVYKSVSADGDGYTDRYTVSEGTVIFGWVVTGVPDGYSPAASMITE